MNPGFYLSLASITLLLAMTACSESELSARARQLQHHRAVLKLPVLPSMACALMHRV